MNKNLLAIETVEENVAVKHFLQQNAGKQILVNLIYMISAQRVL